MASVTYTLDVEPSDSISDAKAELPDQIKIYTDKPEFSSTQLRFVFDGRELEEERTFNDYNIQNGSILRLICQFHYIDLETGCQYFVTYDHLSRTSPQRPIWSHIQLELYGKHDKTWYILKGSHEAYSKRVEEKFGIMVKDANVEFIMQIPTFGGGSLMSIVEMGLGPFFSFLETRHYKNIDGIINFKPQYHKNEYLERAYSFPPKPASTSSWWKFWEQPRESRNDENLTDDEIRHLRLYTTKEFREINLRLLSGAPKYDERVHKINRGIINAIQLDLPDFCYRVANYEPEEFSSLKVGKTIYTSSFTSASRKILEHWGGNTLIIIRLKKGNRLFACDLQKYSAYPKELEIVFALNSPMKILKKTVCKGVPFGNEKVEKFRDYVICMELLK